MNRFVKTYIFCVSALSALTTSCEDRTLGDSYYLSTEAHYLYWDASNFTFMADTYLKRAFDVKSVATPWQIKDFDKSWLTITPESGNNDATINMTAAENTSFNLRTTTAQLISKNPSFSYSQTIAITQHAATPYLTTSESSVKLPASISEETVTVSTNMSWDATTSVEWLTLKPSADKKTLTIIANENLLGYTRYATVYVTGTNGSTGETVKVEVTQSGSTTINSDSNTLDVDCNGGTFSLSITSDVSWTAIAAQSWIQVSTTDGKAGTTTLSVDVAQNSSTNNRTGYVSIMIGGMEQVRITIEQKGMYVKATPSSITFTATLQQKMLDIESNTSWKVLEKPDWLIVSTNEGTGNAKLTLTASENQSATIRKGTLKIGQEGTSVYAEANLTQNGKYFNINPTTFAEVTSKGGTHIVQLKTDDQWTASSTSTWMQLSQKSGLGDIDVTMTILDNPSLKSRNDTTTFTPLCSQSVSIITRQAGRYLRADATALNFFAKGGTSEVVTITTDATYTITSSVTWLTINQTGNTFTATATENEEETDREGKITIAMTGLQAGESFKVEIPVKQRAFIPGLNVEPFGSENAWDIVVGSSMTITVTGFKEEKSWD